MNAAAVVQDAVELWRLVRSIFAPTFTKELENQIVNETETVTLECQLSKPNKAVYWTRNGRRIIQDNRITVEVDVHTHQLVIRDVTPEDTGDYHCVYDNISTTSCTLTTQEFAPEFTKKLKNQTVPELETVTLECQLSKPNKTVIWTKNGEHVIPDNRTTVTVGIYTHRCIIIDVTLEDAGNFGCECGNISTHCILKVVELTTQSRLLNSENHCNWIKTSISLNYLKEGVTEFSNDKADEFHNVIVERVNLIKPKLVSANCRHCTHNQAKKSNKKAKNPTTWRMDCKQNICSVWLTEILPYHQNQPCPNIEWKNSDPRLWPSDGWEIVKLFQPYGCKDQHKAEDCDATGLLTLIQDCSFFSKLINDPTIIKQIKNARNVCMHSNDLEMTATDMMDSLNMMVDFLEEPAINKYPSACKAVVSIKELRDRPLDLSLNKEQQLKAIRNKMTEIEHKMAQLTDTNTNLHDGINSMDTKHDINMEEYRQRLEDFGNKFSDVTETLRALEQCQDPNIGSKVASLTKRVQDLEQANREVDEYYQPKMPTLEAQMHGLKSGVQELEEQQHESGLRLAGIGKTLTKLKPWFTKRLESQMVKETATVILECQLSKADIAVQWMQGVTEVCLSARITVTAHNNTHQLTIRDVTLEDAGNFWCFCGDVSTDCTLTVEELPVDIKAKLCDVNVNEKEAIRLGCQLTKANKPVTWLKDDTEITADDHLNITIDADTHQIVIPKADIDDAGQYSCVCGDARSECTVTVEEFTPNFTKTLEHQIVHEKVTVTLECRLSKPNKTVQWVRDKQQIAPDDRISTSVAIYTHRLIIKDVRMEDKGTFKCECGNVSTDCTLTVEELPEQNDWFDGDKYISWAKTTMSLCFMKEGITEFSNNKASELHKDIKMAVSLRYSAIATCTQCTHELAKKTKDKDKNTTAWRTDCNICSVWLKEILPHHRHENKIEWKNSDPKLWSSNSWEIAKLFQPFGCQDHHRAEDCDATGLLTLIIDCRFFSKFMSNLQLLQEIKDVQNVCMHSNDLIIRDGEMRQSLDKMVTFLGETELQKYHSAREAAEQIKQLRDSRLHLPFKRILDETVLKDKLTEVKHNIKRLDDTNNNLRGGTGSKSAQRDTYLGDYRKRLKQFQDMFSEVENSLQNITREKDNDINKTFTQFIYVMNRLQDITQDIREVDEYYQPKMSTLESVQQDILSESQEQTEQPEERQLTVTAPAPYFSKELSNQTVYEKATVTLECELSQPNQTVRWLKGVTQVCSSERIAVETDTCNHKLIIRNVTLEDDGTFWCFCDNVSSTCTLEVNELAPEFKNKLENHTVIEAATVTLSCQLSKPNKTVQWLRNGNPVLPDERITITADEYIHRLIITDVTLGDCGNFRCICDKESTQCTLTMNEAVPYFLKKLENQTKTENDTVMLMCLLSKPNQKAVWTRDEVTIIPDDHITVTADEYTHQLTISDVTLEDAGNFRCVCGNVSSECKLIVEEAAPYFLKKLENQTKTENDTVMLMCLLSKPNQKAVWTRDEVTIIPDDHITVTADEYTHQLTISDVTLEDAGNFRCVCGNVSSDCKLIVEELPVQFVKPLEDTQGYTKSGTSTTLSCELSRPNQTVTWTKDGHAVSGNTNLKIVSDIYTHQLIFSKLTQGEAGTYTCGFREVTTTAALTVQDDDDQAARELELWQESAEDVRKVVLERSAVLQQLTLYGVNLSSLGDQLSDVLTLQHLVKLTLENFSGVGITLSHEQCKNLGRDLRGSPQLRELSLLGISCTTHGGKSGCEELYLRGPQRLHDITLISLPFARVVFNPEVLLQCVINLPDNVTVQVSALQNLLTARNLQTFTCWNMSDTAAVSKLVDALPQLHGLQQLTLWYIDFGSVTDIRLSATMHQLMSVYLGNCKFDTAGLECLLQQHVLSQRRVEIKLQYVTIRGEEDVISKIRQSPDTEVTKDMSVYYSEGEWKVGNFAFYTRK